MMQTNFASHTPFALSLSKGVLFLSEEKETCFDKLSTNGVLLGYVEVLA